MSALYGDHHNLDDAEVRYALNVAGTRLAELERRLSAVEGKLAKPEGPTPADKVASVRDRFRTSVNHLQRQLDHREEGARSTFDRRYLSGMVAAYIQAAYALEELIKELGE